MKKTFICICFWRFSDSVHIKVFSYSPGVLVIPHRNVGPVRCMTTVGHTHSFNKNLTKVTTATSTSQSGTGAAAVFTTS